jgi:hypothetical protein
MSTRKPTVLQKPSLERTSHELPHGVVSRMGSYVDKIPSSLRHGFLVLSSLLLSSSLFSLTSPVTIGDSLFVSKQFEQWWQVGGLVAWRALELTLARILDFDGELLNFCIIITGYGKCD